jgi:hypothetical protein
MTPHGITGLERVKDLNKLKLVASEYFPDSDFCGRDTCCIFIPKLLAVRQRRGVTVNKLNPGVS